MTDDEMGDLIGREVNKLLRGEADFRERMVEKMLTDPEGRGIAMITPVLAEVTGDDGAIRFGMKTMARLDARVPFGNIYHFDSQESYESWDGMTR